MSTRTTTARPKAAKPTSTAPVQLKSRSKAPAPREPLFSIDGIDYTMPKTVDFGHALSLAQLLRVQPDEHAKRMLLVSQLCGSQALNALLGDATMTRAEWDTIGQILMEKALGPLEQQEDNEGN